jgi:hypothetical protein
MTTTVTAVTTTVSTVTTVTGLVASLGLLTTLALIALLISKEIATATPGSNAIWRGRTLNIRIVPLLITFIVMVAIRLVEVL